MVFLESLLGSGLANTIALKATADALKGEKVDIPRTGIQKELFERAEIAILHKGYDVALPLLIRALKLDPNYLYYYSSLGICYQNLGQFDIALECYDKALDLAEKSWDKEDLALRSKWNFEYQPEWKAKVSNHNEYRKSVRESSKICEKELRTSATKVNVPVDSVMETSKVRVPMEPVKERKIEPVRESSKTSQLKKPVKKDERIELEYGWLDDIQKFRCEYCFKADEEYYHETLRGIKQHIAAKHV